MATPRKRRSNSPVKVSEIVEDFSQNFVEEEETEFFEMLKEAEKAVDVPEPVFRELSIAPTEDLGPRFVPSAQLPTPQPATPPKSAEVPQPVPKRHPRNIPKFSRHKEL
jgi:hypothetical protein